MFKLDLEQLYFALVGRGYFLVDTDVTKHPEAWYILQDWENEIYYLAKTTKLDDETKYPIDKVVYAYGEIIVKFKSGECVRLHLYSNFRGLLPAEWIEEMTQ